MSFIKSAKKGVLWTFLQQFSVTLISFSVQILLARILMPADFGLIAMIAIFVSIGQSLTDSGMTSSLIRNNENTEMDYGTVFISNLGISVAIYIVIFFIAPFISSFYGQIELTNLLRIYSLVFVFNSFSAVQLAKFSKELNFKIQFVYQIPAILASALIGIIMAYNDFGVWSLVWLNVLQALFFSVVLWSIYPWRPKLIFNKEVFRSHFSFGYKLTLSGLLNTIYLNLYKIIIGKYFSPTNVGYFTQADNLRLFPVNQLSTVLNKVTFPLFASISDNTPKLKQAYMSALRLVLSISSAIMFVLMYIAEPLFYVVFGEKWLPAVPYFQILCIASIFLPIGTYNLNILKVKGRSDLFFKVEVIKKIIGVIALLISIPYGIQAMVWALCITNVFFAYLNGYFSGKFINCSLIEQLISTLTVVLIAFIPIICLKVLNEYVYNIASFHFIVQIAVGIIVYFILYIPLVLIFNKKLLKDIKTIIKK